MPTDTWTILHSYGPRLAKRITPNGVEGYERAKTFDVEEVELKGLDDVLSLLRRLEKDPCACLIRGRLREGISPKGVTRTKENFFDAPHRLLPIDLDGADPSTYDILDAGHILAYTGSQGFKPGMHAHAFYWLDKPITGAEAKAWLADTVADPAMFRGVQPIYTAAPILERVADPVPERIIAINGPVVPVPDLEPIVLHDDTHAPIEPLRELTEHARQELIAAMGRMDMDANRDAQIGGWIIDAVAHGMPEAEITERAWNWLEEADPGRQSAQPQEVSDWISNADKGLRSGRFTVAQWYLAPEDEFADDVSEEAAHEDVQTKRSKGFQPLRFTDALVRGIRPMRWLVDGVLPERGVGVLYSPPNIGKTYAVLSIVACVSAGGDWMGHRVRRKGLAIYLHGEGGSEIVNRLEAWRQANSCSTEGLDNVILHDPDALDRPVVLDQIETLKLAAERIEALAETEPVSLVVLDTFSALRGATDENDNSLMAEMWARLHAMSRKLRTLVLVVHHTGRQDKGRLRGASTIDGTLDVALLVDGKPGGDTLTIQCAKMRDGAYFAPIHGRYQPVTLYTNDGTPVPQQALMHVEAAPQTERIEQLLMVLRDVEQHPQDGRKKRCERLELARAPALSRLDELERLYLIENAGSDSRPLWNLSDHGKRICWAEDAGAELQAHIGAVADFE